MLAEAVQAVHTTGINWASVGTIAGSVLTSVGGGARYIVARVEHSRKLAEKSNQAAVAAVTVTVNLKLDQIGKQLAAQDQRQEQTGRLLTDVRERAARIEGQLARS